MTCERFGSEASADATGLSTQSLSLQVEQLQREKIAAEAASAAKSRYLASVSHEIRSPLNSIYGYAQLLERGSGIDPVEAARIIRRSAEHLTNLVEGLVDISQIENGVFRVSRDIVRLPQFLDQIASMVRHQADVKGLRFLYDRPPSLPDLVRMDESRMRQVFINLLTNAIKFTSSGSVSFNVAYAAETAVFEIRDTGPGIAPEDQAAIFEPFRRGSGANILGQPGAGLGLAITQAIVHILGGELTVGSAVGAGTTFRVKMMMGQVTPQIGSVAPSAMIRGYEGERRSILVIDDDPEHLALIDTLLGSLGFDVAIATSGAAGLALGVDRGFDLVLLDIAMPGLSGWETAQRLRGRSGPALRIVMLSANAHERHQAAAQEPVHDHFLLKPVGFDALVDLLGTELGLRWIKQATPDVPAVEIAATGDRLPQAALPHVAKIRESLRIGHVRAIEDQITQLATTGPEAAALCRHLFESLDRYDFVTMNTVLDRYR